MWGKGETEKMSEETKVGWIFLQLLFPFPHDSLIKLA